MLVEFHNSKSLLASKSNNMREHKIVVIGPRKVGKSALVVRFLTKRFISEYLENTDMPCIRVADVDGEPLKVNIQDTSDKAMKSNFIENHLKIADAIMMIYSVTDKEGFIKLKNMAMTMTEKCTNIQDNEQVRLPPLVLVGNKGDLEIHRQVSKTEGLELAENLHCEFFEASAREGWSKLIAKSEPRSSNCSPSSDTDAISLFASSVGTVGLVGLPNQEMSKKFTRCLTPEPTRRRNNIQGCYSDNEASSETKPVKRWGSFNYLNRIGTSSSLTTIFSDAFNGKQNLSSSTLSDDDSDNDSTTGLIFTAKKKKGSNNTSFISRLSPRLSRKFCKSANNSIESLNKKQNNKNLRCGGSFTEKPVTNALSLGLSTTLLSTVKLGEALCAPIEIHTASNFSTSSESSTCTSTFGSIESISPDIADAQNNNNIVSPEKSFKKNTTSGLGAKEPPFLVETFVETRLQENDFSSSEPFLCLFREKLSRSQTRSRSPTHKILNGLKKIKSFTDHNGNNQGVNRNYKINSNNQNFLAVPIIKF